MLIDREITFFVNGSEVQKLPDSPGVYYLYDATRTLLYVGKSVYLRSRVKTHLRNRALNNRNVSIKEKIARVEVWQTVTELAAELLELHHIKLLQPIYNRRSRRNRRLTTAIFSLFSDQLVSLVAGTADQSFNNYNLLFRSRSQANIWLERQVKEHRLCPARLGLQKASDLACFNYQIDKCDGVCVGAASIADHDRKLIPVLQNYQQKSWRHPGALVWENQTKLVKERLVINNWQLQSLHITYPNNTLELAVDDAVFDYDSYRASIRHIEN